MQDEQLEILDFLRRYPPFSELPEETLYRVATSVDVRYFKAGSQIVEFGIDLSQDRALRCTDHRRLALCQKIGEIGAMRIMHFVGSLRNLRQFFGCELTQQLVKTVATASQNGRIVGALPAQQ